MCLAALLVTGCVGGQNVRIPSADTPGPVVPVEIIRPRTAGPFGAVVWLHGCGGLRRGAAHAGDWSGPCRALADRTRLAGQSVGITVYPGAHHAFDSYAPLTRVPEARRGRGATIGGNAKARADSIRQVEAFLAAHLGRRKPTEGH